MSQNAAWKYAARLDESMSATYITRMLEFWGHGPGAPMAANVARLSRATQQQQQQQQPYRPPIATQYVVFNCADGVRYLTSHAVARMCDALVDLLDDLDAEADVVRGATATNNSSNAATPSSSQQQQQQHRDVSSNSDHESSSSSSPTHNNGGEDLQLEQYSFVCGFHFFFSHPQSNTRRKLQNKTEGK